MIAQVAVGFLIVVVVLLALVRSLNLVSEQARQSRAVKQISDASVSYLVSSGIIAASIDAGQSSATKQFERSLGNFRSQFNTAIDDLSGNEAGAARAIERAVDERERVVIAPTISAVAADDLERAQEILNSPASGSTNSRIGREITTLLNARVANQLTEERATKDVATYVAVAVLLAIVAMSSVAAFFLLRIRQRVVPPLEDLDLTAREIADGNLHARARPTGTLETVRAGESFNSMADRVERSIDELRALDLLKDEFVAAVSHDLRTPITVVRAYLDMYLDGEVVDAADQKACMDVISRNVDQLSNLIDDLLTLTFIEAGGERAVHLQPIDLDQLVEDVVRESQPSFESAGIVLDVRSAEGIKAMADPVRVRQVIVNLLTNARKFSDEGSAVSLRARARDGVAEVSVEDRGVGIKPEDLPHIGERFYRTKDVENVPGTGLGMAIVCELLELHGSKLEIESEPGVGSVFKFTLPLAA